MLRKIKIAFFSLVALVFFAGAMLAPLYFKGLLTKETLDILTGKAKPPTKEAPVDASDAFAKALKQREEELNKREEDLKKREEEFTKRAADLESLQKELKDIQGKVATALKSEDTDRQKRIDDVAQSLAKMKPEKAAEALRDLSSQDAALILRKVQELDKRAKILGAMKPEEANKILQEIIGPRI